MQHPISKKKLLALYEKKTNTIYFVEIFSENFNLIFRKHFVNKKIHILEKLLELFKLQKKHLADRITVPFPN